MSEAFSTDTERWVVKFQKRADSKPFYLWDFARDHQVTRYTLQLAEAKMFWDERVARDVAHLTGGSVGRCLVAASGEVKSALMDVVASHYSSERLEVDHFGERKHQDTRDSKLGL